MNNVNFINPATVEGAIFYAIAFLVLACFISRMLHLVVQRALSRQSRLHIDRTRVKFVSQLAQMGIYIFALIYYAHLIPALAKFGDAGLASVGVLSVIAGFAAQSTLGNLISGISLLLYRPFNVGDRLQITAPTGLETAEVESLTLGYTLLKTDDNRRVVIPNSVMASQTIINMTRDDPRVVCTIPIAISYDSDLDHARAILIQLAAGHPKVEKVCGCPVTQLDGFGVVLTLSAWCSNSDEASDLKNDLLEQIKKRFSLEGIKIPTTVRTMVVKN